MSKRVKNVLPWDQPSKVPIQWGTPYDEAVAYIEALFKSSIVAGNIDSDKLDFKKMSWSIQGLNGSGKTTFINYLSVHTDWSVLDMDSARVAIWGWLGGKTFDGTVADYCNDIKYWRNGYNRTVMKMDIDDYVAWLHDATSGSSVRGQNIVLLSPPYDSWYSKLYYRDWDPAVKREHKGHKLLSLSEWIFEQNDYYSDYLHEEPSEYLFVPWFHNYETKDWKSLYKRLSSIR